MMNGKRGGITLAGLALLFVELVVFVAMLPTINQVIQDALPYLASSEMAVWIIQLIPLAIVIGLTVSIFHKDEQMYSLR